ncbi:translation initiation factor IF-2 [Candidatus Peregrinibacteria bacterium]|nr:translation initiation factor IF-2 [Candidatus Peregrinibacteria bacterium]
MSKKISDLAEKLGLDTKELKNKIKELGFDIKPTARTIEDDVAELVIDELNPNKEAESKDTVKIYEEIFDKELDKEIIKQQRKQTAGKDSNKDKEKDKEETEAKRKKQQQEILKKGYIEIPSVISVKEFSEKIAQNPAKVIGELMKNGILANINQQIDFDTAAIIAEDLHIKIKKKREEAAIEDLFAGDLVTLLKEDDPKDLSIRPPIISIMGHVDHGKTKLLDYIRKTNVIASEAGGITQHIGAYQVENNGKKITFLDTPGHEAFTAMRARGAKATDIAILVVAADEGVKPQTLEAMHHAQDAGIPIIVAITKIDKENANVDKVKAELAEHGLQPEEWGGKTIMVPLSSITGQGINTLLDMILLVSEMENLKANPNREAVATVIEAHLDKNLGPIATVLVNTGTLKIMDNVVVGAAHGRIKVMKDYAGKNIKQAGPSTPVLIAGLSIAPQSGDIMQVVKDERTARLRSIQIATLKENAAKEGLLSKDIFAQIASGKLKTLKIVLKADTKGSLEAITSSLSKVRDEEVAIKIIHSAVGNINESDVMMAAASGGLVIGFQVDMPGQAEKVAEREHVQVLKYDIIYKLIEDLTKILAGLLEPEIVEVILGTAEVRKIFFKRKNELVIGCKIIKGKMVNKVKARLKRGTQILGEIVIGSLKKVDENVDEIKEGNECGMKLNTNLEIQEGDEIEAYKLEKKIRTL